MVEGSRLHIRCLEVIHARENKARVCPPHMLQTFLGHIVFKCLLPKGRGWQMFVCDKFDRALISMFVVIFT